MSYAEKRPETGTNTLETVEKMNGIAIVILKGGELMSAKARRILAQSSGLSQQEYA